jgi:hypothetical protein
MTDVLVTVRVDKQTHDQMKRHEELNWSAFLRRSIKQQLAELEHIDTVRAHRALESAEHIRKSGIFAGGKTGAEIIREWRDKRK